VLILADEVGELESGRGGVLALLVELVEESLASRVSPCTTMNRDAGVVSGVLESCSNFERGMILMIASTCLGLLALTSTMAPDPQEVAATITVHADDTLNEILADFVLVNGVSVTYDSEIAEALIRMRSGLLGDLEVSKDQFELVVEGLLASHGFGMTVIPVPNSRVFVTHLASSAPLETPALEVEDREELAAHPALRVRYKASFPLMNHSQLPGTLRPFNPNVLVLIPTEEEVAFEGSGAKVDDLVSMLDAINPAVEHEGFAVAPSEFFQPAKADLELQGVETFLDLVREYNRVTELNVVVTDAARRDLRRQRLGSREPSVPAEMVHSFVSSMLHGAEFSTSIPSSTGPRLLLVELESNSFEVRNLPVSYTTAEEFESYPSLRVMLPMTLKHADSRKMPVMIRPMISATDRVFAIGMGHSKRRVIIGGRAGDLVEPWSAIIAADKQ